MKTTMKSIASLSNLYIWSPCAFLCVVFTCYNGFASSDIQLNVSNNDSIKAVISEKDLNRIVFENDEIQRIYAINGEMDYEIAGKNLYLKQINTKSINFFVETTSSNTYKISLTTKDIPSTQVFIKNASISLIDNKTNYKNHKKLWKYTGENILRQSISKIIKVALADDDTAGYDKQFIGKKLPFHKDIVMYFDSVWTDDSLIAQKYYLENVSSKDKAVDKSEFLALNVAGVHLEKAILKPKEKKTLIIIIKK